MTNSMASSTDDSQQVDWYADRDLMNWLAGGERGASSNTIVQHITGLPAANVGGEPADPADLRRCERLLREVPSLRPFLLSMRERSSAWSVLIDNWDHLVSTAEREVPGCFDKPAKAGEAPKTYALIRAIRESTWPA